MFSDTPLIEYVIIGAHTSAWLVLLGIHVFQIPPESLSSNSAGLLILVAIPFVYLLGMLFDSVAQIVVAPVRNIVKVHVFKGDECPDELIAYRSTTLFRAYEARIQRVRVIGAAILNWPLMGIVVLWDRDFADTDQDRFILLSAVVLTITSIYSCFHLYSRAYKYRLNACKQIATTQSTTPSLATAHLPSKSPKYPERDQDMQGSPQANPTV